MGEQQQYEIGLVARRIVGFAEAIEESHGFGHGPGHHDAPWALEFQRILAPMYARVLPTEYQALLAGWFLHNAATIRSAPYVADEAWQRVEEYLSSVAEAIEEFHGIEVEPAVPPGLNMERTPAVMPFDEIAALVSKSGAAELRRAGERVAAMADPKVDSPLNRDEQQWLLALAEGDRILDVSVRFGFSERTMYRLLNDLWRRLGVSGKTEGLAVAARNGWLNRDDLR